MGRIRRRNGRLPRRLFPGRATSSGRCRHRRPPAAARPLSGPAARPLSRSPDGRDDRAGRRAGPKCVAPPSEPLLPSRRTATSFVLCPRNRVCSGPRRRVARVRDIVPHFMASEAHAAALLSHAAWKKERDALAGPCHLTPLSRDPFSSRIVVTAARTFNSVFLFESVWNGAFPPFPSVSGFECRGHFCWGCL